MKYIKLDLNDSSVFKWEEDEKIVSDFLLCNWPKFRRMYAEQGDTFWVRYLFTLRDYFFTHIFESLVNFLTSNRRTCVHYCLRTVERIIILIHKKFIENKYNQAKDLILDIYSINQISVAKGKFTLSDKCQRKVETLFGTFKNYDRNKDIKIYFALIFYNEFYTSLCSLLKHYMTAPDLPEDFDDNYPQQQYWWPPTSPSSLYETVKFNVYVAKFWGDRLSKILLTSDVHNLYLQIPPLPHACVLNKRDFDLKNPKLNLDAVLRYRSCELHKFCREKVLHEADCKDPYFCMARNGCRIICEVESEDRYREFARQPTFWKSFEIYSHPCSVENHRTVSTMAETFDNLVQTFVIEYEHEVDEVRPPSPPWYLSPELKNSYNQFKKKEEAVARLRGKLEKKSAASRRNGTAKLYVLQGLFSNCKFRTKMYKKASKIIMSEFESEDAKEVDKEELIEKLSKLRFLQCYKDLGTRVKQEDISATVEMPGKRSFGVGYDGSMYCRVLGSRKCCSHMKMCHFKGKCMQKKVYSKTFEVVKDKCQTVHSVMKHECCPCDKNLAPKTVNKIPGKSLIKLYDDIAEDLSKMKMGSEVKTEMPNGDSTKFETRSKCSLNKELKCIHPTNISNGGALVNNMPNSKNSCHSIGKTTVRKNPKKNTLAENIKKLLATSDEKTVTSDTVDREVPDNASDGKVPHNANDGKVPHNAGDGKVPHNASDGKVPHNAGNGKVPHNAGDGKVPHNASDGKIPHNAGNGKVPNNVSDRKVPNNVSDRKVPHNASDGKVPHNAGNGKVPNNVSDRKVPHNAGDGKVPHNAGDGKVPNNAGDGKVPNNAGVEKVPIDVGDEKVSNDASGRKDSVKFTTVSEKLDIIEKSVKENGGLGYEEILLMMAAGNQLVGATDAAPPDVPNKPKKSLPKRLPRVCAYCEKAENKQKFKKCSQCKAENRPKQRYYCSKECQMEDWKERHRDEHR